MPHPDEQSLLRLFEQLLPTERWQELEGPQPQGQIYTLHVVVELMLWQRLSERGTQQEAVHRIAAGMLDHLLPDSKRVREGNISEDTGGYARACSRIPLEKLQEVSDHILAALVQHIKPEADLQRPVLLIDGTGLTLPHEKQLLKSFPPARNQHGDSHWGAVRVLALHDVETGIAFRPSWGAMFGPHAVGEQALTAQVLKQAPAGSVILGDGNFGVFSVAYQVIQNRQEVLFRLTKQRAESLGARKLRPNQETPLDWQPTRKDRETNPELPAGAHVPGRLLVARLKGFRDSLYLFTTLTEPLEKLAELYGKRWNLELDLRTIKCTMHLEHLRGRSRAAIEKELLIGIVAYGLVRTFMAEAAAWAGLHPRVLSFTRCWGQLNARMQKLYLASPEQRPQLLERLLHDMAKSKLPNRSHKRSFPRRVWGFRRKFPLRRSNLHLKSK